MTELIPIGAHSTLDRSTPRSYDGLDRFDRVIKSAWWRYSGTNAYYNTSIAYDHNSNITSTTDGVYPDRSVQYTMDPLNRLTVADEGSRSENWTLSQTGNFSRTKLELDGLAGYTGPGEYDDTRTYSNANELKTRDTNSSGGNPEHTLTYNKRGDMTSDGKLYTYVYDAFGRLRFMKNRTTGNVIEEYTYNALNHRVGQHYDASANGSVGSEDPWLNFVYDDKWRIVATVRGSGGTNGNQTIESSPKELFVYHNAGLGGFGSSSYIDSVILVDQDNTNGLMIGGSAGASDGTLESRRFIMQNWRADVVCTASATGAPLERVRYSAYGVPTLVRVADYNQDGGLDYNDYDAFYADWEEQTGIAADLNLDGVISMADHDLFAADYDTNPTKIGRTHQSAYGVRKGYAGYENDGVITRFSHVRHRVYDNELARWTRRDPIGYVDGMSLYQYVSNSPANHLDPSGLSCINTCANCVFAIGGATGALLAALIACGVLDPELFTKLGCIAAALVVLGAAGGGIVACDDCIACLTGGTPSQPKLPAPSNIPSNTIPTPINVPIQRTPYDQRSPVVPPLWPTTCQSSSGSIGNCFTCCSRNHFSRAFECGNQRIKDYEECDSRWFWRPNWSKCYKDADKKYIACISDTGYDYTNCINNCNTRFPNETAPCQPPEPAKPYL